MASGTITFTASGYLQGKITWSSTSNGSTKNTSSVTATLYAKRTNSYTTTGQSWSGFVKIGSTQKNISFSSSVSVSSSWVKMATVSATVSHNSNGTGSVTISGSVTGPSGTSLADETSKGSKSVTLDTIARASVLGTISNFTIGNAINIPITKYSSSFTDTLTITVGGTQVWSGTVTNGYDVSFSSSQLTTIYSKIPSGTTATFTFKLTTKSGSTTVGTSSKTATGTIPSSVKPSISSVSITEAGSIPSGWGVYVKNKTKLKFVISASAGSGSSVSSVKTTINGVTYTGTTITTNVINTSGNLTATITVTDKRNRTNSTTKTVSILDYGDPYVTNLNVYRCTVDSEGNVSASDKGTCIYVGIKAGVYSINGKNTASYAIEYKKSTVEEYTNQSIPSTNITYDSYVILNNIETTSTYNVRVIVKDYFTDVFKTAAPILSVYRTLNFKPGGRAIGIGKIAEEDNLLDIGLSTKFSGGITPVVLESGTDLNDVLDCGWYTGEYLNSYLNVPENLQQTFDLEVMSGGVSGQLRQRLVTCSKGASVTYERFYYSSSWGDWIEEITRNKLQQILSKAYTLTSTGTVGSNYSSVSTGAVLIGNMLRCYFNATRSAASNSGNITNEIVCTFRIEHNGKILGVYNNTFVNSPTGPVSTFSIQNMSVEDTYCTFEVLLTATANAIDKTVNSYFIIPVVIDIDEY